MKSITKEKNIGVYGVALLRKKKCGKQSLKVRGSQVPKA